MGLKKTNERASREQVYERVSDMQIFNYYLGDFKFRKSYPSVFRVDDNPSCGLYINKSGKIIYNDLTTKEKWDAFAFVAKKYGLTYNGAIQKVACDFGVVKCETPVAVKPVDQKMMVRYEEELRKETVITIEPARWDFRALEYWERYTITEDELVANDVYNIGKLRINDVNINNYGGNLRFAYNVQFKDKSLYKIYQPESEKKQFKWITNISLFLPFGINKLPYKSDTLIITKSVKEMILFKRYFSDVIALQNESQSSLREVTLNFLKKKYKHIFLFFDSDATGIKNAQEYEERGLRPIYLPEKIVTTELKDSADLVEQYGIKAFEKWLKINTLI